MKKSTSKKNKNKQEMSSVNILHSSYSFPSLPPQEQADIPLWWGLLGVPAIVVIHYINKNKYLYKYK